jgi:hypothetical protein
VIDGETMAATLHCHTAMRPTTHLVENEEAETLFEMRNPRPAAFVKQANIANGPQQVNNGVPSAESPSHAGLPTNRSDELLGLNHEQRLDTGTAGAAGGVHSRLETVGAVNRSEDCRGQGGQCDER